MIHFACSTCGKKMRAPAGTAGKKVRCSGCNRLMLIPEDDSEDAEGAELASAPYHQGITLEPFPARQPPPPPIPSNPVPPPVCNVGCPSCGMEVMNDGTFANQTVSCPGCRGQFLMPDPRNAPPPQPAPVRPPPLDITCPHCRATLTVERSQIGRVVSCGACQYPFEVPMPRGEFVGAVPPSGQGVQYPAATPPPPPAQPIGRPASQSLDFDTPERHEEVIPSRRRRRTGEGTTSLIWGLLGLLLCAPLGIVAVMTANSALRDDPDDGMAKAGFVLGWIGTAFCLVACGSVLLYMVGGMMALGLAGR